MDNNTITISANDLLQGIADSKYLGVQEIRNLDIFSDKGVIKIAYKTKNETSSPTTDFIQLHARDYINGADYFADDSGNVFKRTTGGTWSDVTYVSKPANTRGLAVFKDYLFLFYNSGNSVRADRFGPLSSSPTWSANWGTFANASTTIKCPSLVGQDDILYIGINNNVASLSDATSAATINTSALDLPTGKKILSLEELGTNLLIGTLTGETYPWDRISPSFDLPIKTEYDGIYGLKNKNNIVYGICGSNANIIQTNGSQAQDVKRLVTLTHEPTIGFNLSNGALDTFDGGILFGAGKTAGTDNSPSGMYYLKDGIWTYYTLNGATDGSSADLQIGTVVSVGNNTWLASWSDGSTYKVETLDTTRRVQSYGAYFISKMYTVGNRLQKKTFQSGKIQFAKALQTGQGIKIWYRLKSDDTWTELDTFAYGDGSGSDRDNLGAITSFDYNPNIPKAETIQFKVALTTGSSNEYTPELIYVSFE